MAFFATVFPGLINMTAAKISLKEGRPVALSFVVGALVIVFFHALIAVIFARFISKHPEVVSMLQEIGIFIFTLLSIYFFWVAKKPKKPKKSQAVKGKKNRFFVGMLLSVLNILPIPFYVFSSMSLVASGHLTFEQVSVSSFVFGIVLGTFTVFYLYVVAFKVIESKTDFLLKNFNTILGSVTASIAVFALFKLIFK